MNRLMVIVAVATLAGCSPPPMARPNDPVAQQCEYEAEMAIQSIANPLYAGVRKAELMGMCMRAKGRG
ncbi:MAG: hypothetical protein NUV75_01970 [Gallionella sp.]|nr:hypothetical protein [Gallionella sp.]